MGQIGLAGRPVTVADIQRYIAVHHVGAIMASQVPWEWILKIRAAVGSRGMQQGYVRLFRLAASGQPGGRPGSLSDQAGKLAGLAHRPPHNPRRHGRQQGELGRHHRLAKHHRAHQPAQHRATGKRTSR
jgi:hypothetical protein